MAKRKKRINTALLIKGIGQLGGAFYEGYKTKLDESQGGKTVDEGPRLRQKDQPETSYRPKKIKGLYDQYKPFG